MKRSQAINLEKMRKQSLSSFVVKPLAVGIATAGLVACSDTQEGQVYRNVNDCADDNPGNELQCETAYERALSESAASGPKYRTIDDCKVDFGKSNCVPYQSQSGQNWFMPAMAGFIFARALDRNNYYHSTPVYTSYYRHSPFYGSWVGTDGSNYGRMRYGRINVDKKAFKPKPMVKRTISRGGFGSKVAAKSSWGGSRSSSRRGGWGG